MGLVQIRSVVAVEGQGSDGDQSLRRKEARSVAPQLCCMRITWGGGI